MTDLQQNAIDKIDSQAEKLGSSLAKKIAQWIIDNRINNDINAEHIAGVNTNRSLEQCCKKIMDKAKKELGGKSGYVEPETVFGWVDDYYGFVEEPSTKSEKIIDIFDVL